MLIIIRRIYYMQDIKKKGETKKDRKSGVASREREYVQFIHILFPHDDYHEEDGLLMKHIFFLSEKKTCI